MKKIIAFLLITMLLISGCADKTPDETNPGETQAPTYSNEGPEGILDENVPTTVYKLVRAVSLDENGIEQWHREYFYDANGFCTEELEVSNAGTTTYRQVNTPDENGRIGTSQVTEGEGITYTITYTYNDQGRILRQETSSGGQVTDYTEYTYDERGNYLTLKQYYFGELVMDYAFSYTYNDNGNQVARDEYLSGELLGHVEFVYDEQGREIASTSSIAGGASQSRTESTWEGLTETRKYFGMGDTEPYMTSVITYDDHGNVIIEESQYSGGSFTMMEYTYEPFEVMQ